MANVHACHLRIIALELLMWLNHVQSWSNVADGGSREGCTDTLSAQCGIKLRAVEFPSLPLVFPFVPITVWHDWWNSASTMGARI